MQVLILAGGLGTRLRPITQTVPKPMVRINNKPFLYYQLELLKKNSLTDIVLCVGFLGEKIQEYFGNGNVMGLNIQYSFEQQPLDTGGAIKNAKKIISGDFIVVYGDSYLPIDYRHILSRFKSATKTGLLVIYDNKHNTSVKNNIAIDNNGFVIEYNKFNGKENFQYVDAGVSVFKKGILDLMPDKKISLEREVFPKLIEKRELISFKSKVPFYDIGTFERLENAKQILK